MYDVFIVQSDLFAASKLQRNIIQYCAGETGKEKCSSRRQEEPKVQPLFAVHVPKATLDKAAGPKHTQQQVSRQQAKSPCPVRAFATVHNNPGSADWGFLQPQRFYPPDDSHFIRFMYLLVSMQLSALRIRHYINAEVRDVHTYRAYLLQSS
jgi:hypothetical protein